MIYGDKFRQFQAVLRFLGSGLGKLTFIATALANSALAGAAPPAPGTIVPNVATSVQNVGNSLQSAATNTVQITVGSISVAPPTLTKNFAAAAIPIGGNTNLNFRITNSPAKLGQTGISFVDTLPAGLRLTPGATGTVVGAGCAATVSLTAPATIRVDAGSMMPGTEKCDVTVSAITNIAAANLDCSTNPAAFTNGQSSISGLTNANNGVTNQCLLVTPALNIVATGVCVGNVPYVDYSVTPVAVGAPENLKIEWQKTSGQTISTMTNLPMSGRVLWPGASIDAYGNPTAWPGWRLVNNIAYPVNDGLRPETRMIFTANQVSTVVVSYPQSSPLCDPNPPAGPPPKPNLDVSLIKWLSQNYGASPSGRYGVTVRYANASHADGAKSGVQVSDALPAGMLLVPGSLRVRTAGASNAISLPASRGTASIHGAPATYTATEKNISVVFSSLKPGDEGFIEFEVEIATGIPIDTIIRNTADVTWEDEVDSRVTPRTSNTVDFRVTGSEEVTLTGMTLPFVDLGSAVVFENVLTNRSNRTDTFDITLSGSNYPQGTRFKVYKSDGVSLLADTNGNGIADTGPVVAGATYRIIVKAELPSRATGGPYSIVKNAQSISNPLVRASDNDVVGTIAPFCRVLFEPDHTGRVAPGASITYSHVLANVGNCTETITVPLAFLQNQNQGWVAQAFVDNPLAGGQSIASLVDSTDATVSSLTRITLAPGATVIFLIRVTAPTNVVNGSFNLTTLRVDASASGPLTVNDVTTVQMGSTGDISDEIVAYLDPAYLRRTVWGFIGSALYIRADAASCNADPTVIERRTMTITGANGEREEIESIETGPDTGMFVAQRINVRSLPVTQASGVIEGRPSDTLQIEITGCKKKILTTVTLIDPVGVVFDSGTNLPIAGATVRIVSATGGTCTSTSALVSQVVAGQITAVSSSVVTEAQGRFSFPIVQPGDYCLLVSVPNGYTWTSRIPYNQLAPGRNIHATGPTSGGSYGNPFRVGPDTGPIVVDIPADGGSVGGLFVQKTVPRALVELGELIDYTVTVNNRTGYALDQRGVLLTDTLPSGFAYVAGTARRDRKSIGDPQGGAGPRLVFNLGHMVRDQQITVTYRVRIGPGAMQGDGINRAVASYRFGTDSGLPNSGSTLYSESNVATARVEIVGGVFTDRAYIVGKIFADCDSDGVQQANTSGDFETGIPGVRLFLQDGTSAVSDSEGKYSFYGLFAKTHVLKVDRTTLPAGISSADFGLISSRNLGKGDSRIVDLKNGELHKANFAIKICRPEVMSIINSRKLAASSLKSEVEGRLQQRLETDPNLRVQGDVKALPAYGEVGATAPTASIAAPLSVGALAGPTPTGGQPPKPSIRFETLAIAQSENPLNRRERSVREPEIELETLLPAEDNSLGFIGMKSGDVLPFTQTTIRIKGVAGAAFKLKVNDQMVGDDRVGKKAVFAEKSSQAWEFFGVDLAVGENTLTVLQFDEFGNARGEKSIKVMAPGVLARVKVSFNGGISDSAIADGITPSSVVVSLFDRNNVPVTSRVAISLSTSLGRWNVEDQNPAEPGLQTYVEGGSAEFNLIPPSEPGQADILVSSGDIKGEAKLDFLPNLRDLIAVGVIEGILNLRKLDPRGLVPARAQDGFEQEIKHTARNWNNGESDAATRTAMFLKGKVRGEYLLTMAFDSDKNTRERLFRDIQPDEFYPIYGDSSVRAFDAQSTARFYLRIDNKKSYLLYGDFNTSQATDARKLSNFSRSLTGVKEHFENSRISANVFASRDSTRQVIDEFSANGTSGPFKLTRASGLINSEKIEILTRDRNQTSVIVRAQPLARFVDYELEPLTGRILFKSPIASLDENLNPISIRITYEVDQGGEQFWVTGADAQIKLTSNIEVGVVGVDDRNPIDKFRMLGVNAIAKLADKTFLVAELARTRREAFANAISQGEKTGDAKRIEFRHISGNVEANLYAARADQNFDNPSASLSRGRQEIGGKLSYRFDEKTRLKVELLRTEDLVVGDKRDGLLLAVEHTLGNGLRVEAGVRHAREAQPALATPGADGIAIPDQLTAVRVRVTGDLPMLKEATAYVEAEVDVKDSARKIAAIGADYRLGASGRIYLRHEFISSLTGPYGLNNQQRQNSTVIGVNTDYMKDGNLFSEYRVRDAISGGDAEAAFGLRNLWTLAEGLKLQTGFERVQALTGSGDSESIAATFGLEYTASPVWKGSARLELRQGRNSDSVLSTFAGASKLSNDWTFLGRNTYSLIRNKGQNSGEIEQDRLQLGLAYRDTQTDKWNALGRIEHRAEYDTTQPGIELKRAVELISIHANWQPRRPFTFSARYAAKWVSDKSNGMATKNNAQLLAGRALWDIAPRWDAGLNVSTMFARGTQSKVYGLGIELGFFVMENLWISGGYNFFGYRDDDLASGEHTSKGAFIRLRYKFDEDLFKPTLSGKRDNASGLLGAAQQQAVTPIVEQYSAVGEK